MCASLTSKCADRPRQSKIYSLASVASSKRLFSEAAVMGARLLVSAGWVDGAAAAGLTAEGAMAAD